jgi:hypothetical protein
MGGVFDLKSLVRGLADSLAAIYEPDGSGYAIEVPLTGDRYQTVTVFAGDAENIELLTVVHELDKTARSTLEKFQKLTKTCRITLEPEPENGVYRACVRAIVPEAEATTPNVKPLLVEVAGLGDGIERELTGGDVD